MRGSAVPQGVARAAAGADPAWREFAFLALRGLAQQQREVHVDDLYAACGWHPPRPNAWGAACGWHPPRPNAWGAVWQRAIREGVLQKTGRSRVTRLPEKHAHDYPVYRSLLFPVSGDTRSKIGTGDAPLASQQQG